MGEFTIFNTFILNATIFSIGNNVKLCMVSHKAVVGSLRFTPVISSTAVSKSYIFVPDDPSKKELLRITMALREANKISQHLKKNIVSV